MSKRPPADSGKRLNDHFRIGAAHALFRETGTFYVELERFPGVLFDKSGFVLYKTKTDFNEAEQAGHLKLGRPTEKDKKRRIDVPGGIASMPNYVRFVDHVIAGLSPDDAEIVKMLLQRRFPRHRIAG